MNQPTNDSTRRTSAEVVTTSVKKPGRILPLASGRHVSIPKDRRQSRDSRPWAGGSSHTPRTPPSSGPQRPYSASTSSWTSGAIQASSSRKKTGSPVVRSIPRLR